MESHEDKTVKFDRVGLFRLDVLFTHPIVIGDEAELAVLPAMMYKPDKWNGMNDRLFYGRRDFAEVWATHRFTASTNYIKWQQETFPQSTRRGLHSEDFVRYLTTVYGRMPLKIKDFCFKRLRSNGNVLDSDCKMLSYEGAKQPVKHAFESSEPDGLRLENSPGLIILGMHRAGTSMLAGLLSEVFDFEVPGKHVTGKEHPEQNAKGFLENYDVVRQNDEWLRQQGM